MAMAGRIRSSGPLFQRILRSGSLSAQRSTVQRSLLCPSFTNSESSRNYATSAPAKEQKVKLPLALFGGTGNYASALYVAAVKANALDMVESELLDFVEATKRSALYSEFVKDLSMPVARRLKAINAVSGEAKFSKLTKNFLAILAENGRLRNLESIAKRFTELTMAHRGEVKAIVTSVIPLPPAEEKDLKETLQEILGHGKKVKVEQKIDPSILGGIVVEFDLKVFDMSIKTRAMQMARLLREPVNFDGL
ncbi:ATP synthase subunit O, mitochondrial [Cornus florida]|uniref:ATP synthase subunit O, mitochondrial n=1 Tax=Cornus florida TaxID=4283 RepID=UPI0028A0A756|nr:ATP synthase subunit O, mitochondrial [Cornus florida]